MAFRGSYYLKLLPFIIVQVQCADAELDKKVDEKIGQFIDRVEKHPNKKNQVYCLP